MQVYVRVCVLREGGTNGEACRWLHRIIESQGWKGRTRSSSPTILPSPLLPQLLNHILYLLIQTSLEHCQGRQLRHLPGQAMPVPDRPLREKAFPYVQSKPPLVQLVAVSSGPVCFLGEEAKPLLITASLWEVVECSEVSFVMNFSCLYLSLSLVDEKIIFEKFTRAVV